MTNPVANPVISVVTATRNVEAVLPRLYRSLATQTDRNFEWIVMDGLSTDRTAHVMRQYAEESPWIRFFSEADFGLYDAINKGIRAARGRYYVVAGADDVFDASALENYTRIATQNDADVILARVRRGERIIGGFHPRKSWIGHAPVFSGSHSVGMMFRTELHTHFGYYSNRFPLLADGYFLKTLLKCSTVAFIDADFVAGTFSEGGVSTVNQLQILAETWQIQMLTEKSTIVQTVLFAGKMLLRLPAIRRELQQRGILQVSGGRCT